MRWRPGAHIALLLLVLFFSAVIARSPGDHEPSPPAANDFNPASQRLAHQPQSSHASLHPSKSPAAVDPDANAVVTLSPASGPAAKPPPLPASSSAHGGAAAVSRLQPRSLQDWDVEDFVLMATVDGTIHARDRKTGMPRWALELPSPMVDTVYHRPARDDFSSQTAPEDDFMWIVEPSRDGDLYVYNQAPNGGLQKLGLTVRSLFEQTPYSATDPPVTYTARKETTLYTVDAATGSVLRVFSSHGPVSPDQNCRRVRFGDAEDCEPTGGTLTLGRVEYTVSVQNTETGNPICTIKFAEWAPNNRDSDLQSQYFRTMDDRHIYSMHDGVVFGFDHSKPNGRRYTHKFPSPVVRVFDVARPLSSDGSDTPLVLLSQPVQPADPDYSSVGLDRESLVFINCTEQGGWYAMSELTYPLVTGRARQAECYTKDYQSMPLSSLSLKQQKAALVGVHSLNEASVRQQRRIPSISGPQSINDTPQDIARLPERSSLPPALRNSVIISKGWDNATDIVITLILMFVAAFVYFNSENIQHIAKKKLDLKNVIPINTDPSEPKTPVIATPKSKVTFFESKGDIPPVPTAIPGAPSLDGITPQSGSSTPKAGVPQIAVDLAPDGSVFTPEKPKKKPHRGRRGGQGHRRGKKKEQESPDQPQTQVDDPSPKDQTEQTMLAPEVPVAKQLSSESVMADGSLRIGQLKVFTNTVLGHGSHGTVVYRGSFDGRDVAVKRMLVEFYDIASHEVYLLQESDDHHNVIRYFCREQTAGFLYIALELCPASLQDIIEKPQEFSELLAADLDVPDILRQITFGVRYLHSLKIVHRDLKPQNILVTSPKRARGTLRMLISDFGLCKKLEDNQSSFRATTAHAAGTSGWRAPELLVDDDRSNSPPTVSDNSSSQGAESSEPAVVDPQTNRRATRAIDIFSLGCVFYYVLTRGGHPFDKDGKFMREANIVKGHHNLDDLQRLGDYAFEADDMIRQMLSLDPRRRYVCPFPFFLLFLYARPTNYFAALMLLPF